MKLTIGITFGFLVFLGNVLQQNNCCGDDTPCWAETPFTCNAPFFDPCGDQFCGWELDGWEDDPNNALFERPKIKYSCPVDTHGAFYVNPVQTRGSCDLPVESGGMGKENQSEDKTHVCFKLRPCALGCTVLSTTRDPSEWPSYRKKAGTTGPYPVLPKRTLYKATCDDGTQTTGDDVTVSKVDYKDCVGATCNK